MPLSPDLRDFTYYCDSSRFFSLFTVYFFGKGSKGGIVYAPDKSSGKRQQRVRIFFNFIDEVEIPEVFEPIIYERPTKNRKTA